MNDFHARSERGVLQEFYAHFNLIAATRIFANDGDDLPGGCGKKKSRK